MKQRYLIKNTRVLNADKHRCETADILLDSENGVYNVAEIGARLNCGSAQIINASSLYAVPAFIDLWSHIGEIGYEYREDFSTGTTAAICGGYGYLLIAPDGKSVTDSPSVLEKRLKESSASAKCQVGFVGALSKSMKGNKLCDFEAMKGLGAVAFGDGKKENLPDDLLYEAMRLLAKCDSLFIGHPRYHAEYKECAANLGRVSRILGVKGIPASAEALDVARYLLYAAETGCRLHLCGISTKASLELIAQAKARSLNITASTSPQYFSMSENDILFYGARAKVYPPLRASSDVEAVVSALADQTLDCISSDHTPLANEEKGSDFKTAADGSIGLQTAFSAADTYLLESRKIDVYRLFELMYAAPASILGIDHSIRQGSNAYINLVSPDREFIVTNNYLKSRSSNSIFMGLNLRGCVERSFISNKY
ncbi:MAG: amidohydrolase family protein [Clostridia bacterium]|nr:amidohydrolase family protein [Clostridia bacterium]